MWKEKYNIHTITNEFLKKRAKLACEDVGLSYGPHYDTVNEKTIINYGNVELVRNISGWELEKLGSDNTGISYINGNYNSMTKSEMMAFLSGMIEAVRILKDNGKLL